MNDERYLRGKIYKIVNDVSDKCYVGSTINALRIRFNQHKSCYKKRTITENSKLIFDEHFGSTKILLIQEYPCENKMQLHKRERDWIEYFGRETCVNKHIPTRTYKEWREYNKDEQKEYHKQHYEKNKEKLRKQMKEYYKINKDNIKEQHKKYREKNKEYNKEYYKQYYENNKDNMIERHKEYRERNKEKISENKKKYHEINKEKIRERKKKKVKCEICDYEVCRYSLLRHKKSKKHLNNLLKK